MDASVSVEVKGLEELKRVLRDLPLQMRKKVLLSALRKAARIPLLAARKEVPVLSSENAAKNPYRTAGLLKRRLTVRTSRVARQAGNVGVFINVKPAAGAKYKTSTTKVLGIKFTDRRLVKKGERGAKSPNDPFYWRFVEFGTKKMQARPFLQPAAETLPEALFVFEREIAAYVNKVNATK
jgi:HK97 gp10 family phage protein